MPKTKVKSKEQGLGGGKSGAKGNGVVQSVLDMQSQMGNEQTVKTVLGPDVATQFSAMAAKGGKQSSLFFTTSTYKQIKKSLAEYSAKQGSKPGAWRRGHVGQLDGLLESWFSKDKNSQDTSPVGKAKWAAMKWLQPKVKAEQSSLSGEKTKEESTTPPVEQQAQPEQQWQQGEAPGGEQTGPVIGKRGWQKGAKGGERGGVTIGGGRAKKPEVPKQDEAPKEEPVDEKVQDGPQGGYGAYSVTAFDDAPKDDGPTGGYGAYSVTAFDDPYALDEDEKKKYDDQVDEKVEQYVDAKVDEEVKEGSGAYSPVEFKDPYAEEDNAKQGDKDDEKEASSAVSESKSSSTAILSSSKSSKQASSSQTSKSKQSEVDDIVDGVAKEIPKWNAFRKRGDEYVNEFDVGSVVLVALYNDVREARKIVDDEGKFVAWDNPKKRKPGSVPLVDDAERAEYSVFAWHWSKSTFNKYWKLMTQQWGESPPDLAPPKKSELGFEDMFDSSVSDPTATDSSIDDRYASEKSESGPNEEDEQEESEGGEPKKKKLELLVKSKEGDDREKYRLGLGPSITRGPLRRPLDTKEMMTNKAGAGYGIFVMSQNGEMFAGSHKVGIFHHSSFLAAGNVAGAGELKVSGGKLQHLTNKSGHYLPTDEHNLQVIEELKGAGIAPSSYEFTNYEKNDKTTPYSSAQAYLDQMTQKGKRAIPNR